jgi:hypothetical protein
MPLSGSLAANTAVEVRAARSARQCAENNSRRVAGGADSVNSGRLRTMDKLRRALRVLLWLGLPWMLGVHDVYAAEPSGSDRESTGANSAASNESAQREWRDKLRRPAASGPGSALFETKSWVPEPPPPRPVARAPAPPPAPPPFPYQFLGRLEMEGKPRTVYLTKDDQVYSVAPGEVIEGTYQVLDVTTESMEVTYLPLKMKQQIVFANIVPTMGRQAAGGRTSDTPAIVAPTTVAVPPPFNLSPPMNAEATRDPSPPGQPATREPRSAQRANVPDQAAVSRGTAGQQQGATSTGAGDRAPAPSSAGTASAVPSLSPSPVVVSPPTLSAFGATAPAPPAAPPGSQPQAGTAPAAPSSGAAAPSAPPPGRM